jgi:hypothetical protein
MSGGMKNASNTEIRCTEVFSYQRTRHGGDPVFRSVESFMSKKFLESMKFKIMLHNIMDDPKNVIGNFCDF